MSISEKFISSFFRVEKHISTIHSDNTANALRVWQEVVNNVSEMTATSIFRIQHTEYSGDY
jgi:hypothetical protein